MKITDIKTYIVGSGSKSVLKIDPESSESYIKNRSYLLVKIETDNGLYGWGESGVSSRETAVQSMVNHFREWLVGEDAENISALWQRMYRSQYYEGGHIISAAISAIDIALYDVLGRNLGVPVYQLLGGKHRDYIPCFATTNAETKEQLIEDVKSLIDSGWTVIRTGIFPVSFEDSSLFEPRDSISEIAESLVELRSQIGSKPVLGIDYHHRLSVAEAASFCQKMPKGTLDFLEEPIRDETPQAYSTLRSMTDVPFAIGEEMSSKWQFMPFIEQGLTNYARIDLCNIGGYTEAMKVAGWCESHYIDVMPHNPLGPVATAAMIHFSAAIPNFAWLEDRSIEPGFDFDKKVYTEKYELEGTWYKVRDVAGLGIEIDENEAVKHDFQYWETPHLHRKDGSLTNW